LLCSIGFLVVVAILLCSIGFLVVVEQENQWNITR
jgi:hypothetical protein